VVTYGVVLLSIVMTAFLVMLVDKTKLADLYGWILSPGLPRLPFRKAPDSGLNKLHSLTHIAKDSSDIESTGTKLFGVSEEDE